ncbi:MAG: polyprenyl synthetase family protein [Thermodesulfobacteriota bacterium]|nr:polyprenyl synthetase family protein [Thermodesulfobacteriota bacterium]
MNVLNLSTFRNEEKTSFDAILKWIGDDLEKVDHEFRKNLRSDVPIISAIGEHLLLSGGKRFRPLLLILAARLCGYRGQDHISMASLIEFIHTATLLHDDVVDRAELRRGIESANSIWGSEACVLVGDFLFTKCFSLMVENGNRKILEAISRATTLMAEGELEELIRTNDLSLTEAGYLSIVSRKTGALISVATQIGAILGEAPEVKERALSDFGMDLGIAFQLIDDNLDYISREEEFGKKIGIDLQDGKITLPLVHTLNHCGEGEKAIIREAVNSNPVTKEAFFEVVEIIERHRGLNYAFEEARGYVEKAKGRLHLFPDSKEKEALFALSDYVLERRL